MIASLIDIIQGMSDQERKDEEWNGEAKKTRRAKAKVPSLGTKTTRRTKRKDSSDECTLPEIIPRNQFTQMKLNQSFESEITRLVVQVPLSSFVGEKFQQVQTTRVENIPLQMRVSRENDNICCGFRLPEDIILGQNPQIGIIVHGKYSWLSSNSITTKQIKSVRKVLSKDNWEETSWLKLVPVHSDFFITLSIKKEEEECDDYLGLVNQGNTCYMNSYLQMLFHLPAFRKLIFSAEITQTDKFPATLQMLFYKLLEDEKSVSPEELIKSFGWSKKDAKVQQDVQEFSCLFFDVLERKVMVSKPEHFGNIPQLFCGQLTHYIQCCHVGIVSADFRTQNHERFYDLHVPLAPTIAESLDDFVGEQVLDQDNRYQTDYYGLQEARKGLVISKLPPVLMLQLKRFQYNYFTDSNQKILTQCKYPEHMDFSKWTSDPQTSNPYLLYAVLVHEGSFANSGHYYVYIKTGGKWIKFNDERVEKATREKALHYNYGGQSQIVEYDSKEMKLGFKGVQNKATAYMLVYANKNIYNILFEELKPQFPAWLIKQTQYRQEMQEEKKLRKQSICDIPILRWSKDFLNHSIDGVGFVPPDVQVQEKIAMIPKTQKVVDWVEGLKIDGEEKDIYMKWTVQDKEVVMNINCRNTLTMKELFSQVSDPYLFFAPLSTSKQDFLVVVKLFHQEDNELHFQRLTSIKKESTVMDLYAHLASIYPKNSLFYLQDKKQGVIPILSSESTLLPSPSPARNQLLIVTVEEVPQGQIGEKVLKLYKQELDHLKIFFKNEVNRQFSWQRWLNKFVTVDEIRKIIFDEVVTEKEEYQSPSNIVVKYRPKKSSKVLNEAKDTDQLKDITKHDKVLFFSFSSLSIDQRLTQKELIFYYRNPLSLKLSEPQSIVVKKITKDSLIDLLLSSDILKTQLPLEKGHDYRLFLLSKDRNYINDIINRNGTVPGKGDLAAVLEKEKHSALVVESYQVRQEEGKLINVLVHHVTKTGQKIGIPRWESVPGDSLLSTLKTFLLDSISKEQIEFQGKIYPVNPMKVRVLGYTKEWARAEQLPESDQYQENKQISENVTVQSRYGGARYLRIGIVHNQIAKSIQALKLNVQ